MKRNKEIKQGHTPGPWKYWAKSQTLVTGGCSDDWEHKNFRGWAAQNRANARLMAASPELLSALEKAVKGCIDGGFDETDNVVKIARAAIAKAKGEL